MQERFDYDLLSEGDAIWLKRQTEAIKSNFRDEVYLKLKNGLRLRRVKARINKGHFLTWIDLEFSWSRTTANRLIRLVEVVEKFFLKRISTVENLSEEDKKIFWKNLDEGTFDSTVHAVLELLNNFSICDAVMIRGSVYHSAGLINVQLVEAVSKLEPTEKKF